MGLGIMINVPAFAVVSHAEIDKDVFLIDGSFTVSGTVTEEDRVWVNVFIDGPGIKAPEQKRVQTDDSKKFSILLTASEYFDDKGTYTIDVFTSQKDDAIIIEVINDGKKLTTLGNFDVILEPIGSKQIDATERLTFTASITESEISETYSLVNEPKGATINSNTGVFSWTPTSSQVGGHIFDIVVNVGPVEDRETIQVTVNQGQVEPVEERQKPVESTEPQKPRELGVAAFVDKTADPQSYVDRYNSEPAYKEWFDENYPEYESIYEAVGLETPTPVAEVRAAASVAVFVDEAVDPQSYVDRYNSEPAYKEWFDENFPEYESIYEAVGLETPSPVAKVEPSAPVAEVEPSAPVAVFVDEAVDPQSYVDRYNSEPAYKEWFDENFPEYESIYEAVGLKTPVPLAAFVDEAVDPQSYVDRYNSEPAYKEWFDENYPEYESIYEAVGLEDPAAMTAKDGAGELEIGECGEGTDLVDGYCLIVEQPKSGGCLIATAAYGSELAPQVQLLREIRDNQLMDTDSGTLFMTGFNQLYYSFSPTIADMERANPVFKEMIKVTITPLLSSLAIMSHAESETEVLGYGIGVILMNVGMYIAAPAVIIFKAKKYIKM